VTKRPNKDLIADAQAFIQSVKDFGTPARAEKFRTNQSQSEEETSSQTPKQSFTPKFSFEQNPSKPNFWPKLKLTDFRREAITFVETHYFKYKSLPAISDFKQHFADTPNLLPESPKAWDDFFLSIQEPLQNRGIPSYETPLNYLEPNFVLAVSLICNPYDRRAIAAKLKEAGLTTKQWTGFLRQDHYQEYYRQRLDDIFNEDMQQEAKLALTHLIQAKDLGAIKHYHELQNIYRPNNTNQVQVILQAIMEVLARNVDSSILSRVATELQATETLRQAIPAKSTNTELAFKPVVPNPAAL
jgi:hypothetical protein